MCGGGNGECSGLLGVQSPNNLVSSGGAPTPAGTSVFTKHNWDMGMGICRLMGGASIT